jgi:hypothetical protein
MKRKHVKTFLIWMVVLNWPPLLWLTQYDFLRLLCMLPYLFWINIPALWLGIAKLIGKPHYDIQEFGAMPLTVFSWVPIIAFWVLVAIGLSVLTAYFPGFPGVYYQSRKKKETASNNTSEGIRQPAAGSPKPSM